MENRLKQETKPVLQELAAARIRSVMVTGKCPQAAVGPMGERYTPLASSIARPWSLPGLPLCYGRSEEPASPLSLQGTT